MNCKKCLHEKVCALWVASEGQDASCYTDDCFEPKVAEENDSHKRYIVLYVTEEFKKLMNDETLESYAFSYDEHDVVLRKFGDKYMFYVYNVEKGETLLTIDASMVAAIDYDSYHNCEIEGDGNG